MEDMTVIISLAVSILSLCISLITVIVNYHISKRKLFTDVFSQYRIYWINNVRDLLNKYIQFYYEGNRKKMHKCKGNIDVYLNFKYDDHKAFSELLQQSILNENNDKDITKIIIESQKLIDNYWRKAKAEAGMTKKVNQKIRKITYNNGKLYD